MSKLEWFDEDGWEIHAKPEDALDYAISEDLDYFLKKLREFAVGDYCLDDFFFEYIQEKEDDIIRWLLN